VHWATLVVMGFIFGGYTATRTTSSAEMYFANVQTAISSSLHACPHPAQPPFLALAPHACLGPTEAVDLRYRKPGCQATVAASSGCLSSGGCKLVITSRTGSAHPTALRHIDFSESLGSPVL
jgi:hypothetical protein